MSKQVVKVLVKGEVDTKEFFNVKQRNSAGDLVALDITGFTITIIIYNLDKTSLIVNGASVAIENASQGSCSYTVQTASTTTIGRYLGRLKFVSGTQTFYSKEFQWVVEDRG